MRFFFSLIIFPVFFLLYFGDAFIFFGNILNDCHLADSAVLDQSFWKPMKPMCANETFTDVYHQIHISTWQTDKHDQNANKYRSIKRQLMVTIAYSSIRQNSYYRSFQCVWNCRDMWWLRQVWAANANFYRFKGKKKKPI